MFPRSTFIPLLYTVLSSTLHHVAHSFASKHVPYFSGKVPFTTFPCPNSVLSVRPTSALNVLGESLESIGSSPNDVPSESFKSPITAMKKIFKTSVNDRKEVFTITQPEDLIKFLHQDERLCVVKVSAKWCNTCKRFDMRWRKLTCQQEGKRHVRGEIFDFGRARFAEIEFTTNEELCRGLKATKLPYILIYKNMVKKDGFECLPSEFQKLVDKVDEFVVTSKNT